MSLESQILGIIASLSLSSDVLQQPNVLTCSWGIFCNMKFQEIKTSQKSLYRTGFVIRGNNFIRQSTRSIARDVERKLDLQWALKKK